MNSELKEFIEKYVHLLDDMRIDVLYSTLAMNRLHTVSPSSLTQLLIEIGIDPLEHMNRVARGMYERDMNLEVMQLPDNIGKVDAVAFKDCLYLQSVFIPASVKRIGVEAFMNCVQLHDIKIENGLEFVAHDTFKNCTSLEEIFIPDSCYDIDTGVFMQCKKLKKVSLPPNLKCLSHFLFDGCTNLKTIEYRGLRDMWDELPKHEKWLPDLPHTVTVKCLNGDLKYVHGVKFI